MKNPKPFKSFRHIILRRFSVSGGRLTRRAGRPGALDVAEAEDERGEGGEEEDEVVVLDLPRVGDQEGRAAQAHGQAQEAGGNAQAWNDRW